MKSPALLAWLLVLAGCGTTTWQSARDDAGDRSAHERAELALVTGDAAAAAELAEAALATAKAGSEAEARAFATLLVASDALAMFERPLPYLARVLTATNDPKVAARVVTEAERAWGRLDGQSAASPDVRAALERIAAMPGVAWEEARARALRELVTAERLRAGPLAAREAAVAAGMSIEWRMSAPWGDAPLVDFERALCPETRALGVTELTGAGWDLIPTATTTQVFSDGEATFFDMPTSGGVGFAQTSSTVVGSARLRLETNRWARVYVDGVVVLDRLSSNDSWLATADVELRAGALITVKLATADGRGFFRLQVTPGEGAAPTKERPVAVGDARAAVQALLALEERLSRPYWDPADARERVAQLEASFGPHPSLDRLAARLALGDVAAPIAERRRAARARYEAVLARAPGHAAARRGLARIERDEERPDRALALLLAGDIDVRTRLDLLDLHRERGWEVEVLATAAELEPVALGSPRLMQELVDTYRAFGRIALATRFAEALEARFPSAGVERLYGLFGDRNEVRTKDLLGLWYAEPQRQSLLRTALAGMRRAGRAPHEIDQDLGVFLSQRPQDGWALGERVRVALDDPEQAKARIREALDVVPDFAPMESLLHHLEGTPERFDVLEDGREVVKRWKASTSADASWLGAPIVNLLERRRIDVRKDGSTLELTHRVRLVQTKQGVDELGDVRPPEGVRLLVARTLKADGRVLEPERTPGKPELSFSELEPGDAVETAWVSRSRVAPNEGGYLTGVSFASWGTPIFELDVEIEVAPGMALATHRFGGAPAEVRSERKIAWKINRLEPIAKESMSVSARSFFPFVDVRVVRADVPQDGFARITRSYVARLASLAVPGPRLAELSAQLRKKRRPFAEVAFEWVKADLNDQEQLNTFETPVEAAIANRKGNRALVLWALLRNQAIPAEILLCAPERDGVPEDRASPTPNPNRFFYPIVRAELRDGLRYFDPSRPYTPPGDLPGELGGAACLSLGKPEPRFSELPPASRAPTFEADITLVIDADGNAQGTLIGLARGAAASPLRQAFLAQDEARQHAFFEQWLGSLVVGAALVELDVQDASSPTEPMRWRLVIELAGYARREGDTWVVQRPIVPLVHASFAGVPEFAKLVSPPTRETPLRLWPFSEQVTISVRMPGHTPLAPSPMTSVVGTQTGQIVRDALVLRRQVAIAPGRVTPADYPAFRVAVGDTLRAFDAPLRFKAP